MSNNSNCPKCNKPISKEDEFCRFCGTKLINNKLKEQKLTEHEGASENIKVEVEGDMEIGNKNNSAKFSSSISFALLGAVFYILSNSRFQSNLMRPAEWGDGFLMMDMPGFITIIILMFIVGLFAGSVADKQKK